jgi:hypothetical protein
MSTGSRSRSDRRALAVIVLVAAVVAALVPLSLVAEAPSVCLFRNLTGIPCPGCGLTRSVVATAHLRPAEGFGFHLFGPLVFVAALAWALLTLTGRTLPPIDWRRNRAVQLLGAAWLAWAVLRAV